MKTRLCLCLSLVLACLPPSAGRAAQVWFGGVEPVHQSFPPDYMDLFAPDAPWAHAASRLSVFKISSETVLHGSDDMIRTIFGDLRRRRLAVAVEMGGLLQSPDETCGGGEGFLQTHQIDRLGTRLRALGFSVDYLAMDSPVWFGHERTWRVLRGRPDCQYPVADIVRRAAQVVGMLRRYFPALRAGEIEVISNRLPPGQVLEDYADFARGMRAATGQGLAFFHCDTAWDSPGWRALVARAQNQAHALGMRFGVIVGGSPQDPTDEAWVQDGLARLKQLAPLLDDVIVQSWQAKPTRMLPETAPSTATYFLGRADSAF